VKKSSLAILLATPKGGRGEDEDDDGAEDSEGDYEALAEAAFPDEDWTPDRLKAFKELVMACMGS
jgi:hypothetical protein